MGPMFTFTSNGTTTDFWNTSYLGFNAHRSSTGVWKSYSVANGGGASTSGNNGGVIMRAGLNGDFYISCLPKSTTNSNTERTYTDSELGQYTVLRLRYVESNHSDPAFLDVPGTIRAKVVRVRANGWWPDFVFSPEYALRPLSELQAYIQRHRHLPEFPSAQEVAAQDGVDLADMNRKLLQKVEELTLYILQLNQRIEALEQR
jgi:hypothetical protein